MKTCPKLRKAKANLGFLVCQYCSFNTDTKIHTEYGMERKKTWPDGLVAGDDCPECKSQAVTCMKCNAIEYRPWDMLMCAECLADSYYVGVV